MSLKQYIDSHYMTVPNRPTPVELQEIYRKYLGKTYPELDRDLQHNSKVVLNSIKSEEHHFKPEDVSSSGLRYALNYDSGHLALQHVLTGIFANYKASYAFRSLIKTLKLVGEGTFGTVFTACIKCEDDKPDSVVKIAHGKNEVISSQLEAAIGFCVINPLIQAAPNFNTTYAVTSCANTSCSVQKANSMVIIQRAPGITLYNKLQTLDLVGLVDVLAQIFLSMQVALDASDFTHYDLHTRNILVEEHTQPKELIYTMYDRTVVLSSYYTITIIDYGKATALCNDIRVGETHPAFGVEPNSNPTQDILTLLISCARDSGNTSTASGIYDVLYRLVNFYDTSPLHVFKHYADLDIDYLNALAITCATLNVYPQGDAYAEAPGTIGSYSPSVSEMEDAITSGTTTMSPRDLNLLIHYMAVLDRQPNDRIARYYVESIPHDPDELESYLKIYGKTNAASSALSHLK